MFEASLENKLKQIFDLDKVTFNLPSEDQEQEVIFVEVESARSKIRDKEQLCHVTGNIRIFAQAEKLPYGYIAKKIAEASTDLTADFFFFDIEDNAGTYMNKCARSLSFVYLFKSQYDPNQGTMNEINFTIEVG